MSDWNTFFILVRKTELLLIYAIELDNFRH